jgi:hypothetical protein
MWRVDAYQMPYYSRGIEEAKRTHPRFADWYYTIPIVRRHGQDKSENGLCLLSPPHWKVLKNGDPHYLVLQATSITKFYLTVYYFQHSLAQMYFIYCHLNFHANLLIPHKLMATHQIAVLYCQASTPRLCPWSMSFPYIHIYINLTRPLKKMQACEFFPLLYYILKKNSDAPSPCGRNMHWK